MIEFIDVFKKQKPLFLMGGAIENYSWELNIYFLFLSCSFSYSSREEKAKIMKKKAKIKANKICSPGFLAANCITRNAIVKRISFIGEKLWRKKLAFRQIIRNIALLDFVWVLRFGGTFAFLVRKQKTNALRFSSSFLFFSVKFGKKWGFLVNKSPSLL